MSYSGLKVGFQTKIELEIGKSLAFDGGCIDNIRMPLSELTRKNNNNLYLIPSKEIYLEGDDVFANAFPFKRISSVHNDYRDLIVSAPQKIDINLLDSLVIRGDDLEENLSLDEIYPKINQSKVYVPIDYWEMKATKDKLDTAKRFRDRKSVV